MSTRFRQLIYAALVLASLSTLAEGYCKDFVPEASSWEEALRLGDEIAQDLQPPCKAERYYEVALALLATNAPEDHGAQSLVLDRLGQARQALGDLDEAEVSFLQSLRLRLGQSGAEAEVAATLDNLGGLYYQRGDPAQGFEVYQQALRYREQAFGSDSLEVGKSLGLLASAYELRGELKEAVEHYQRAVSIYRANAKTPEDREQLGILLINLGLLLEQRGEEAQGRELQHAGNQILDELSSD